VATWETKLKLNSFQNDLIEILCLSSLSIAIFVGAFIAFKNQISLLVFLPNFTGLIFGGLLISFSGRLAPYIREGNKHLAFSYIILLMATLFSSDLDGVYRWLPLGLFQLNVSMSLAPIGIYSLIRLNKKFVLGFLAICAIIYFLQPDSGQATAFAFACMMILAFRKDLTIYTKLTGVLIITIGAVAAWFRSDPLLPVRHVEEILHLAVAAGSISTATAFFAIIFLFSSLVTIFIQSRDNQTTLYCGAIFVFWFITFVVTELGHFPVPVIGAGAAGVLGWSFTFLFLLVDL
jgi:hypothetical protein